jgi:hypothetical protein
LGNNWFSGTRKRSPASPRPGRCFPPPLGTARTQNGLPGQQVNPLFPQEYNALFLLVLL